MAPPDNSARLLYLAPKKFPTMTPTKDRQNVVQPMTEIAGTMFTSKKAKVTPIASASMLVAIAHQK